MTAMLEELAAIEHERWSHWQRYLHSKGTMQPDGSLLLPPDLVRRWEGQFDTPYSQLSEKEKDSDRDQVRKYLPTVVKALTEGSG
jgi:hypothetical protein